MADEEKTDKTTETEAAAETNGGDLVAEGDQVAVSEPAAVAPEPVAEEKTKPKRRVGLRKKKDDK